MKKSLFAILLATATLTIFSCQKSPVEPRAASTDEGPVWGREGDPQCPPTEVTLLAGQTINSGTVTVTNDADFIYVTYTTTNGWVLSQTHLYVGECGLIPVNNPGNPIPGQFPYSGNHNNITSYTYTIPISAIPAGGCGCVAAHAVVKKLNSSGQVIESQTGWGNGTPINVNGGNWGMKFAYCSCVL
jgi:hypothetical protein